MSPGFNMSPAYIEESAGQRPTCEFSREEEVSKLQGCRVSESSFAEEFKDFLRALHVSAVKPTPPPPMPRTAAAGTQPAPRPESPPIPAPDRRGSPLP